MTEPIRTSRINTWLIALLLGLVGVLIYRQAFWFAPLFNSNSEPRVVTPRGNLSDEELSTIEVFKQVSPSVVHITTLAVRRDMFTLDVHEIPAGTGSGFVWDKEGHIVTNLHVVSAGQGATVTLADNTNYSARFVGYDASNDLAVLKINAPPAKLIPISLGVSHDLQVGQKVFAIGSPFELDHTLTTGIISGLNRTIGTDTGRINGAIQTDAAINPGNSGGPLLDSAGLLVGVNTAIVSESGGSHGVGFAVPVDVINIAVPDLIQDGSISRPWLGVTIRENVIVNAGGGKVQRLRGVLVVEVLPNSPAHIAGIRAMGRQGPRDSIVADQLIAINGERVESRQELLKRLSSCQPGQSVLVTIIREGEVIKIPVKLEKRPK
jgi:S1-C subfamily serine protease